MMIVRYVVFIHLSLCLCLVYVYTSSVYADHSLTGPTISGVSGTIDNSHNEVEEVHEQPVLVAGYDEEFLQALERMHDFGLSRFSSPETFRPYDLLSRQEAAKFFSQFAKEILYRTIDQTKYCFFDDMDGVDPSLKNYIIESCLLHMFGGSGGYFFPFDTFTKGQAMAVLMRGLTGYEEEGGTYWRGIYWQNAWEAGLTKDPNISHGNNPVTRYEVALLLYRAAKKIQK